MRDPEKLEGIPNVKSISGSEGLPEGAKKFNDIPTAQLLKQMWNQKIALYYQTQISIDDLGADGKSILGLERFVVKISGIDSQTFNGELHPEVEGHSWFRGIAVQVDPHNSSNQVIIFSGWMQPWLENAPAPIVYTIGDIPAQTVRTVIQRYTTRISSHIDRLRVFHPNQYNK